MTVIHIATMIIDRYLYVTVSSVSFLLFIEKPGAEGHLPDDLYRLRYDILFFAVVSII